MSLTELTNADEQDLLSRIHQLADSGGDGGKAAQKSRSARYGIGVKEGGNVTKPGKWSDVPDGQWGDPVNYRYPMKDAAHANNAASRWGDASNRSQYNSHEQGIIGGRITRRQRALGVGGSDSKEKSLDDIMTAEEHAEDVLLTKDALGPHPPHMGTHSHSHSHGPDDEAHEHEHIHQNDNAHQHDHTGNLDGDGGTPDGDGDQDDWNEPRAGGQADNSIPEPNGSSETPANRANDDSNAGRANSSGSTSAPLSSPMAVPNDLKNTPAEHTAALLEHYNKVGASLGFAPVDAEGRRADVVLVDVRLAGKAPSLDNGHAVHAQAVHDHANAMLSGKGCANYATRMASMPTTASAPTEDIELQGRMATMKATLDASEQRALHLATQIEELEGRGRGRPTTFRQRTLPTPYVDYENEDIQAQTPEELRAGTTIARRTDGVLCRSWSAGHGVHQRPALSTDQMSIMSPRDLDAYRTGQAVLVPMIYDGD